MEFKFELGKTTVKDFLMQIKLTDKFGFLTDKEMARQDPYSLIHFFSEPTVYLRSCLAQLAADELRKNSRYALKFWINVHFPLK
jgi:hypothetical protein